MKHDVDGEEGKRGEHSLNNKEKLVKGSGGVKTNGGSGRRGGRDDVTSVAPQQAVAVLGRRHMASEGERVIAVHVA